MNFGEWSSRIYKKTFPFLVGAIFLIVMFGVAQFFMSVEAALAIEKSETNKYITMSIVMVVSFILTWLIANVMEGEKLNVLFGETAGFILLGLAALCVIGLMAWGATVYLSGAPSWALVIIFLLVLLLFK